MTDTNDTLPTRPILCDECGHTNAVHRMQFESGFPERCECQREDCSCPRFVFPPRKGDRPILTSDRPVEPGLEAALERVRTSGDRLRTTLREQMKRFERFLTDLRSDAWRRDRDH